MCLTHTDLSNFRVPNIAYLNLSLQGLSKTKEVRTLKSPDRVRVIKKEWEEGEEGRGERDMLIHLLSHLFIISGPLTSQILKLVRPAPALKNLMEVKDSCAGWNHGQSAHGSIGNRLENTGFFHQKQCGVLIEEALDLDFGNNQIFSAEEIIGAKAQRLGGHVGLLEEEDWSLPGEEFGGRRRLAW